MSDVRDPERDQQLPEGSDSMPIHIQVQVDIAERMVHGTRKYGHPLQAGNGRNALQDAYEEVLDLAVYLKQCLVEGQQARPEFSRDADPEQVMENLKREGQRIADQYVTRACKSTDHCEGAYEEDESGRWVCDECGGEEA